MPLAIAELGGLGGVGERVFHPAELIDQAELARRAAVPNAPLTDRIDLFGGLAARLADQADEPPIAVLDRRLDQSFDLRVEAAEDIRLTRERTGLDPVAGHPPVRQC